MKNKDKMEKCKTCINRNKEMSDDNWIACDPKKITIEVMLSGTSENCGNYEKETK